MVKFLNALFFILSISFSVQCQEAQQPLIDSLLNSISNKSIHDTVKADSYYELALAYLYQNPDSAEFFVNKGLELSETNQFIDGMGQGYAWMAYLNEDKGNISEAIDYNLKSLGIVQEQNLVNEYPVILNNLGTLHLKLNNNKKALHYFKECEQINIDLDKQLSLATNYFNIGIVYSNLGQQKKSTEYYKKSIDIRIDIGDEKGLANSYSALGTVYIRLDSLDLAVSYHQKGLVLREKNELKKGIALSLIGLGSIYLKKLDYSKAYDNAIRAYEIAKKWGFKQQLKESAKVLYKIKKVQNKNKEALFYHEVYTALHDSIHSIENQDALIRSEYEFEYNKKHLIDSLEQDKIIIKNQLLNEENKVKENKLSVQRLWLTVSILFILLLLIMLVFIRKNSRIRMEKLRTEIKLRLVETLKLKDELAVKSESIQIPNQGLNIVLFDKLTSREQEILDKLVLGLSNKEIGEKLFLSVNTIKTHINNLYVKLDVSNRTQAAVKGSLLKIQKKT